MIKFTIVFALFILHPFSFTISATDVYIGISGSGEEKKMALFMPPLEGEGPQGQNLAQKIWDVLRADLLYSRYFEVTSKGPTRLQIKGKVQDLKDKVVLEAKLLDTQNNDTIVEKYYQLPVSDFRQAAHLFADEVVLRVTGKRGIAHTRIAFSNNQTGFKEIYMVDYDGANLKQLTFDQSMTLIPRWSPDGRHLVYTTYRHNNPDLYDLDIAQNKISPLSTYQGINMAGGFSPDGSLLAITLSKEKDPNIYILSLRNRKMSRLTFHRGVDASASFSPDGRQVAFISDRSGNPQLYLIELDSSRTQKLTNLNWCDSPIWSPTGEWIVFAGRTSVMNRMDIFLTDLTGNQLRQLTRGEGSNEDPSWSPDGRFIAFTSTRNGRKELFIMDADGSSPHPIARIPGNSFTPSWSP
ncbi:MAG: PD40 domain-containing protein [Elusimicrobia bacterium]|nr:PD40 domain-containing protein [Elusimicrobiota bacterium]